MTNILDFGACGNTKLNADRTLSVGMDCTNAFKTALSTVKTIDVPAGGYYIKGGLELLQSCTLKGEGRTSSVIYIDSNYSKDTSYILKLNHYSEIYDIGFHFYQPEVDSRSSLIQFPYAIDCSDSNRVIVDRVRIENGFNGVKATGNTGGSYFGFLEIGCFNKGIVFDGALDFVHGTKWHFWPFEIVNSPKLTAIYSDGQATAMEVGAVDGFNVENIAAFQQKFSFTENAKSVIPYLIGNLQLDGDGSRLITRGGTISIGKVYDTKSSACLVESIVTQMDSKVDISYLRISSDAKAYSCKTFDSSKLHVHGGDIQAINVYGGCVFVQGGTAIFEDCTMNPNSGTQYNNAYCVNAGGILKVRRCTWTAKTTGSGYAIFFATDDSKNQAKYNNVNGWLFGVQANGRLKGTYSNNTGMVSDYNINDLVAEFKIATFQQTSDASGTLVVDTGVTNINLKVLKCEAYYKGPNGEAIPCQVSFIDSRNVYVSGAYPTRPIRVSLQYTMNSFSDW